MRHLKRSALVAQPPGRVYALINDIESYPRFLPWCTTARVVERSPAHIVATLGVRRGAMKAEFTTRNELVPDRRIHMRLVSGPFRTLEGEWLLWPVGAAGGTGGTSAAAGAVAGVAGAGSAAPAGDVPGGDAAAAAEAAGAAGAMADDAVAGTRIELSLRFAFSNPLTALVFEPLFAETAAQLVDAFVARAREPVPAGTGP